MNLHQLHPQTVGQSPAGGAIKERAFVYQIKVRFLYLGRYIKENYIKNEVGTAKNAALTLFLCLKTRKMLVYFCSFYAAAKNEEKARTERFELSKSCLSKEYST